MPLLQKAAASGEGDGGLSLSRAGVVNMSTKVASIADNGKGGNYLYRGSKVRHRNIYINLKSIVFLFDGVSYCCMLENYIWQTYMM